MTARRKAGAGAALTRRSFVTLVAAGSAALLASPGLAGAAGAARRRPRPAPAKPAAPANAAQKEYDRQRAATLATLKTIREHPLPPGGDLSVVFRPRRTRARGH